MKLHMKVCKNHHGLVNILVNIQQYLIEVPEENLITKGFQCKKISDVYYLRAPETMQAFVWTYACTCLYQLIKLLDGYKASLNGPVKTGKEKLG